MHVIKGGGRNKGFINQQSYFGAIILRFLRRPGS
jgi:hypothetical protein